MERKEWRDMYRDAMKEWRERTREWRIKMREWRDRSKETMKKGMFPLPPVPPLPPTTFVPGSRSNVVTSRIGDEELKAIDMLTEAGVFSTRSEAVAYLVREGIEARKDVLGKVASSLEEIRRIRKEAEEYITKLREEIGLAEAEDIREQEKTCSECSRDLTNLPEDITICPYCGSKLKK